MEEKGMNYPVERKNNQRLIKRLGKTPEIKKDRHMTETL
jgi:hypothetical protein